jgi:MFS family permease
MRLPAYRHYLLGVLTILLLFNYIDRVALGLLLQDIKVDLNLTDTQLGFLTGIAFALFYSVMGVPIARWADRGNRVLIISLTAIAWSVAVALCGVAHSFVQLLLIRIVVAVGEAGCVPPAFSLLPEYFQRSERPRATAIYGVGGAASFIVSYFLAGWLNELYGWRMTFVLLGAPGLVLAALAWFTLKEPRRTSGWRVAPAPAPQPALTEVCRVLWRSRTFRHLLICLSVLYFFGYGILQWQPAFFVRSYGLGTREIGTWLAMTYGVGGLLGAYLGGEWSVRQAPNDERTQLRAMSLAIVSSGVLSTLVYICPSPYVGFVLVGLAAVGLYTTNGPLLATIQTLVPEHMRAVTFALVYLVANLIGMGLGPLTAGAMSDAFRPWAGDESLRYSLLILAPGYFWCAWHAWRAGDTVAHDLAHARLDAPALAESEPDSSKSLGLAGSN